MTQKQKKPSDDMKKEKKKRNEKESIYQSINFPPLGDTIKLFM